MKKQIALLTLISSTLAFCAQSPVVSANKPAVTPKTTAPVATPAVKKPTAPAQNPQQPPAEFIQLLQKNAEKIDALITQVKAGTDEKAKKIVTEIEAIHQELKAFEEKQKAEFKKAAPVSAPSAATKAKKIE